MAAGADQVMAVVVLLTVIVVEAVTVL
jgi:hypothetical protein